ncbi:MAG: Trk system potassium transporter TrkA [Peptoniphilus sp.]|nr:Trk system potassium transporter TrkA [Peptoniphilus sp.]
MKILILGAGKVGQKILKSMSLSDNSIVIMDRDASILSEIDESKKVKVLQNKSIDKALFNELKIQTYDYVVSVTDSDKTNILSSTLAKKMGAKFTICRINQAESMEQIQYLRDYLGIDRIVNPDFETVASIEEIIKSDISYQSDKFGKGKIEVVGHSVKLDPDFENKKIKDIGSLYTILVVGVLRGLDIIIPDGEFVLRENDYLYLMGLSKDIMSFKMKHFKIIEEKAKKKIVVVGTNEMSAQLVQSMKEEELTIVGRDNDKCNKFRKNFPDAFVLNSKLTGSEFFKFNEIDKSDVFLALTDNEELNIVLAMMAKKFNIEKVMVKILSSEYVNILDDLNLTAILNPLDIASNIIIRILNGDRGISTYMTFNGQAEVMELKLKEDSSLIDKRIKEIQMPKGILIGGIVRRDQSVVIPRGNTVFEKEDTLIIFYKKENSRELRRFIKEESEGGFLRNLIK